MGRASGYINGRFGTVTEADNKLFWFPVWGRTLNVYPQGPDGAEQGQFQDFRLVFTEWVTNKFLKLVDNFRTKVLKKTIASQSHNPVMIK